MLYRIHIHRNDRPKTCFFLMSMDGTLTERAELALEVREITKEVEAAVEKCAIRYSTFVSAAAEIALATNDMIPASIRNLVRLD